MTMWGWFIIVTTAYQHPHNAEPPGRHILFLWGRGRSRLSSPQLTSSVFSVLSYPRIAWPVMPCAEPAKFHLVLCPVSGDISVSLCSSMCVCVWGVCGSCGWRCVCMFVPLCVCPDGRSRITHERLSLYSPNDNGYGNDNDSDNDNDNNDNNYMGLIENTQWKYNWNSNFSSRNITYDLQKCR